MLGRTLALPEQKDLGGLRAKRSAFRDSSRVLHDGIDMNGRAMHERESW
jgi:hypothetical protein